MAFESNQPMDIRVSAISHQSVELLNDLGAWQDIQAMRVCPYKRLETWEHPECRTRFHSDSLGLEQLGFIVENRLVQLGLWNQFSQFDEIALFCPDSLAHIELGDLPLLHLSSGQQIQAQWVIGADGANSKVRDLAGIGITAWDYRQYCMLVNVETELPQQDITWQQFFPSGPRSFLPLCGNQGSLVWYDKPQRIRQLLAKTPKQLENEVHSYFPSELGQVKVLQSGAFPLTRRHAQSYSNNRCILMGDSAHTINPLAGQGVNLGFKDVAKFIELVAESGCINDSVLAQYESQRKRDNLLMQSGMDVFYKGFSNDLLPLKIARNAALKIADKAGPLKEKVLKYALGL